MEKLDEYAKALVAAVGAVTVVVLTLVDAAGELTEALTALAATFTALGVYRVPNRTPDE